MAAVQSLVTLTANFCAILVDEGLGNIAQINLAGPIKEKGAMSDEIDLEGLDAYLMSDDSPENCMMLSDLDGFLHGVVCSPIEVPQAECLRKAMGGPLVRFPLKSFRPSPTSMTTSARVWPYRSLRQNRSSGGPRKAM